MGCLVNLINFVSLLVLTLIFGAMAYVLMGAWFLVLIPVILVALWLDGIWGDSRPGEFWRNAGERLASRRPLCPSPRYAAPASSPTPGIALPGHVSALAEDLGPLLARLYRALHQPDSLSADARLGGVSSRLCAAGTGLRDMHRALLALKETVAETSFRDEETRAAVIARIDGAAAEIIRAYAGVYASLREQPGDQRLIRLEGNLRANLERLSMWLASLLLVLRDPGRILLEGEPNGGTRMAMEFHLRFSWPESLAELDAWTDTPTGYDAGHVRAGLDAGLGVPEASRAASTPKPDLAQATVTTRPTSRDG